MTSGMIHQLAALQRIAAFSASVRGHELGEWRMAEHFAQASCKHCGAELRVYVSTFQPEMDGATLEQTCPRHAVAVHAA